MSKTKWGATLIGVGVIFGIIGDSLSGGSWSLEVIKQLFEAVGGVVTIWGVRDWPIINKKR